MSLDYSKWDKLVADLSDEEDEQGYKKASPQVTCFQNPTTITIPGRSPEPSSSPPVSMRRDIKSGEGVGEKSSNLAKNGFECDKYCWSQDKEEVKLTVWIDPQVRAKAVRVSLDKQTMELWIQVSKTDVLSGKLAYNVEFDDDYDGGVEWQLESFGKRKCVLATFRKKSPIKSAIIWWSRYNASKNQCHVGDT